VSTAARREFAERLQELKYRLHPLNNNPPLAALYARLQAEPNPATKHAIARDVDVMEKSVDVSGHAAVFQVVESVVADVCTAWSGTVPLWLS
jgi:hypothetical protein